MAAYEGYNPNLGIQVSVTLRKGKTWPPVTADIRVRYEETVAVLKKRIANCFAISVGQVQLFWQNKELTNAFDDKTMLDMNIHTGFGIQGYDLSEDPDYWPPAVETPEGFVLQPPYVQSHGQ